MPFQGFEGPAGTGKTHRLIEDVIAWVTGHPLEPHQQVLALTFMHGSRRRLDQRLSDIPSLRGRFSCMTLDSLAEQLVERWKSLCAHYGLVPGDFEETVNCAAQLLELPVVGQWLATTFPIVLVDEAQELTPARLRLVQALTQHAKCFVAADEFQCLNDQIDPALFRRWFVTGQITQLAQVHRTNQQGLLDAAVALRSGTAPANGPGLQIRYEFKNQAPFAIGHTLHRGLRDGGDIALIVAPSAKGWADELVSRLVIGFRSAKQTVGALRIGWETRSDDEVAQVMAGITGAGSIPYTTILSDLTNIPDPPPWLSEVANAIDHQRRACGQLVWTKEALQALSERKAAIHRAYAYGRSSGIPVMSIHGAKNRQFRHVVVLWPPGVPGNQDQQRRLLYNAITRAQKSCTVFVRTEALLKAPPFF